MLFHALQSGADPTVLAAKSGERSEASALLERKMSAMEAVLTARRKSIELAVAEVHSSGWVWGGSAGQWVSWAVGQLGLVPSTAQRGSAVRLCRRK